MKTLELKLKKDVLIVDTTAPIEAIEIDDYEFICKGSELTEEMASELVETHKNCRRYFDYKIKERNRFFDLPIPSFISAVESKGFHWMENPIDEPNKYVQRCMSFENLSNQFKLFDDKEQKTFRNPLIFVKK